MRSVETPNRELATRSAAAACSSCPARSPAEGINRPIGGYPGRRSRRPPRLSPMPEHLELPRPLRLLRTTAWSLTESAGFPMAAFAIAAWLGGRDAGLVA